MALELFSSLLNEHIDERSEVTEAVHGQGNYIIVLYTLCLVTFTNITVISFFALWRVPGSYGDRWPNEAPYLEDNNGLLWVWTLLSFLDGLMRKHHPMNCHIPAQAGVTLFRLFPISLPLFMYENKCHGTLPRKHCQIPAYRQTALT